MKIFVFFSVCFITALTWAGPPGVSEPPVWNPFGGHLQYLGPGNGLLQGDTYYLYHDGTNTAYYTYVGTDFCFYLNGIQQICYSSAIPNSFLLLEDGTFILLEDGTKIILQ